MPYPILFRTLRVISLLPIIGWPMVFFMSLFLFDDPNANKAMVWALFIGMNVYPPLLIGNVFLSNYAFKRNQPLGYILISWPLVLSIFMFLI